MATSLAAAIKNRIGIDVTLAEGHGGIFEVAAGDNILYTNQSECCRRPSNEEIVQKIKEYRTGSIKQKESGSG